jgi:hypothetical protein
MDDVHGFGLSCNHSPDYSYSELTAVCFFIVMHTIVFVDSISPNC